MCDAFRRTISLILALSFRFRDENERIYTGVGLSVRPCVLGVIMYEIGQLLAGSIIVVAGLVGIFWALRAMEDRREGRKFTTGERFLVAFIIIFGLFVTIWLSGIASGDPI